MTATIEATMVERFRTVIAARLGLLFDESKLAVLADVLRRRVDTSVHDVDTYLSRLEAQPDREELGALALDLTVPETYFFRNIDQYRALTEVVLPQRVASRITDRHLRILSLGCASGEEPYTIAMLVRDMLAEAGWEASICGVDVNPAVIERAKRGRFSAWALRETPERDRRRWFHSEGRDWVLDETIRASVRFEQRNLVEDDPQFWQRERYDVIFCRNVIMYFSPEQAQVVIDRVARTLCSDGYLFLGHAETLRGISTDFHLRHTHGTFYYQRKRSDAPRSTPSQFPDSRQPPIASLATLTTDSDTWVEAIRRASERVTALTDSRERAGDRPGDATRPASPWDLSLVVEMLRKERFADALTIVDALPPESSRDSDVLLLRAVLLAHGGQLDDAEYACRSLLELDELSAGAHYLLALCREGDGDRAAARHHDQVAAYLDPGFAMPRLHLGLLARRTGDHASARNELGQALVLLQREEASRLLLFGGGFSREALIALCRADLSRCGGHR